jgi:hypothetical protein
VVSIKNENTVTFQPTDKNNIVSFPAGNSVKKEDTNNTNSKHYESLIIPEVFDIKFFASSYTEDGI